MIYQAGHQYQAISSSRRDLFEGIIDDPLVNGLDWQNLQPPPSDYINEELRQRQGDRVWRIPRRAGSPLYVLLMLEHQARNDHYMALRILTYCGLLYQSLLQHRLITRKFGAQPNTLQHRIKTATPAQLETWSLNILDAETLDEVFAA